MSLFPQEDIEMGKGYTSRFSLRIVRLVLAGALLATLLAFSGVTFEGGSLVLTPPAMAADEPGGATGGG